MHKVICEEPRHGGGRVKQGRRANRTEDQLPKEEGMKQRHNGCRKHFGEHLGPLRRWLRSKLGRDWNEVYSEAAKVIKPDSVVRAHIRFHMLEMVERNTFIKEGEVWCITSYRWSGGREIPVQKLGKRWHPFYVHPETGVLCEIPDKARSLTLQEKVERKFGQVRKQISKHCLLIKLRGHWFECWMWPLNNHWETSPIDVVFKCPLASAHAHEVYGDPVYCQEKRQLSRKELRQLGLTNSGASADCLLSVLGDDLVDRIHRSNGNPVRCWLQCRIHFWIEASAVQFPSYFKFSIGGMTPLDKPV